MNNALLLQLSFGVRFNFRRFTSSHHIRNIGVLAHIDAGKTTTTERMLFYAGRTNSMGEVHRGNTVTDYLTQERERGITICSSAVTFPWRNHKINLLDTPGHIDFTMEVEQALHAVDGVVIVLDATAGVEAQTLTVWSQADKHGLPKIIFVNKMDRPDADFEECISDIKQKLDGKPLCLQQPLKDNEGNLSILDIITMQGFTWDAQSSGKEYRLFSIKDNEILQSLREKRYEIIDVLSGMDDELAEVVINTESFEKISNELIYSAMRRVTCQQKTVPIFLGSAYKNVGVQSLMDALVNFLPAPYERNTVYNLFQDEFVGKVFKIVHDKQRGALTLIRVFRGTLKKGMRLVSATGYSEAVGRIYEPLADEYREINEVSEGDVAVCSGLKQTVTGDLLTTSASLLRQVCNRLRKIQTDYEDGEKDKAKSENIMEDNVANSNALHEHFSIKTQIPDAVYFCSIEPPNLSSQTAMEVALKQLQREDPSLRISYDATTAQTILGGMGELHMDIIKSRILTEYKIDVELGPLQIAYKEVIIKPSLFTFNMEKDIVGSKQSVSITIELLNNKKEIFSLDTLAENANNLNALRPQILRIIKKGALSALERGPRLGGQVVETQIKLHRATIGRGTADSFVLSSAAQCVQKILLSSGTRLLEPMMSLQIITPSEHVNSILKDLARRRAVINNVLAKSIHKKSIYVIAPLAELHGYSSFLRTISSGTANMMMQPSGFASMSAADEDIAIKRAQGFI